MSNVLANHEIDEMHKREQPEEVEVTLDREQAEALYTVLGILEIECCLDGLHAKLSMFCNGESRFSINEPDDTLRLTELPQ